MSKQVYIHYGATAFDPTINFPIKNRKAWMKPKGGLWASKKNATFGWKDWCTENEFRECDQANSFEFVVKDESKVFIITQTTQLHNLPAIENRYRCPWYLIDFEKCLKSGIDAVELRWYGDEYQDTAKGDLWSELYGWDCDSIVVLNPDAVILLPHK